MPFYTSDYEKSHSTYTVNRINLFKRTDLLSNYAERNRKSEYHFIKQLEKAVAKNLFFIKDSEDNLTIIFNKVKRQPNRNFDIKTYVFVGIPSDIDDGRKPYD